MMSINAGQMIDILKSVHSDTIVLVDGYEEGFAEDIRVQEVSVSRNGNGLRDGIYGRHSKIGWRGNPDEVTMRAVLIGEDRHDIMSERG